MDSNTLKEIRIDLLTAADETLGDYNQGLVKADEIRKKWHCNNLFNIAADLQSHGYLEKVCLFYDRRFSLGSLTNKGIKYLKELKGENNPQIINNTNKIIGNGNNIQQGNYNTINTEGLNYFQLDLFLKAIENIKEDYLKEGGNKDLFNQLDNLKALSKDKAPVSKIKQTFEKAKTILSSQTTTNAVSVISIILNAINLFK